MEVFRQIKEYDNGIYTSFIDTNSYVLFSDDIDKGLYYFEKAGGTFLINEVGERFYGEIQLDNISFMIQALEYGEIKYDENIYDDFIYMRKCCLEDKENNKRYASDFFNIYIL